MHEYRSPFLSPTSFFCSLSEDACTTLLRTGTTRPHTPTATTIPTDITTTTICFREIGGGSIIRIMVIVMDTEVIVPEGDERLYIKSYPTRTRADREPSLSALLNCLENQQFSPPRNHHNYNQHHRNEYCKKKSVHSTGCRIIESSLRSSPPMLQYSWQQVP